MSENHNKTAKKGKAVPRRRKLSPEAMALLPYPEFALSPHMASGRWFKVHEGNRSYFGKLADGWEAAYKRHEAEWPQIVADRKPRPDVSEQASAAG